MRARAGRTPALAALLAAQCPAIAQDDLAAPRNPIGYPGGGLALSLQGSFAVETHINFLWGAGAGRRKDHLYQFGPEIQLGIHLGAPSHWSLHGERFGLRQTWLYQGILGLTATIGAENYAQRFMLEDTRWFVQAGPTLLGCLSVEYGLSQPMTGARPLVDLDRVMIRLEINPAALAKAFRGIPLS